MCMFVYGEFCAFLFFYFLLTTSERVVPGAAVRWQNSRRFPSPSSGGQMSEAKVSAGWFLVGCEEASVPCIAPSSSVPGVPWLVDPLPQSQPPPSHIFPVCMSVRVQISPFQIRSQSQILVLGRLQHFFFREHNSTHNRHYFSDLLWFSSKHSLESICICLQRYLAGFSFLHESLWYGFTVSSTTPLLRLFFFCFFSSYF